MNQSILTPRERLHLVLSGDIPDHYPKRLIYISPEQLQILWPDQTPNNPVEALRWRHNHYETHGSIPGGFLRPVVFDDGNQYEIHCETGARLLGRRIPTQTHYVDQPIIEKSDLAKFKLPDLNDPSRYEGVMETIQIHHDAGCFVAVHVLGTFQGTNLMLRPFSDLLMDIVQEPDFAIRLLEKYNDFLIEDVCRRLEMGADGVYVCDDLGMNDRMLISPKHYRAIIKPLHIKQVQRFKQFPNVKVILHCDGCVKDIMDDLVEVGFDEINPVDPADNMKVGLLKKSHGDKISLSGGFDRHVGMMPEKQLLDHIGHVIESGKPDGRYISTFPVYPEMKTDLMIKAIRLIEENSFY